MKPVFHRIFNVFATACVATSLAAVSPLSRAQDDDAMQTVIADGGVTISRAEFAEILRTAAPKAVERATTNMDDRLELINALLATRRIAAEADEMTVDDSLYWELQFALIAAKRDIVLKQFMDDLEVPDLEPLAREYYDTQREKYALVPEKRASSHILLASRPGLDRKGVRAKAAQILEELEAGADWSTMVAEHSDDPGSKARDGSLNRWVSYGEIGISPPYTEALFEVEAIGGYSRVTDTQFGVHIIRLDDIQPAYDRPYEEVREKILADVTREFRQRAARVNRARYNITDDIFIDGEAMDELFAPYESK